MFVKGYFQNASQFLHQVSSLKKMYVREICDSQCKEARCQRTEVHFLVMQDPGKKMYSSNTLVYGEGKLWRSMQTSSYISACD
jgi:hypothetical protein